MQPSRGPAGLSGERLARRCHMSQSKVSRIETGRLLPSVVDVERILRALDVDQATSAELLALAHVANAEYQDIRATVRRGLQHRQRELAALEADAKQMRHFLPALPTGLLQIPEYMRVGRSRPLAGAGPLKDHAQSRASPSSVASRRRSGVSGAPDAGCLARRVARTEPDRIRAKAIRMSGVSGSPRMPAPRATATAGLRKVMTVARAGPTSAMSMKNRMSAAAVHTAASTAREASTRAGGSACGRLVMATGR